VEANGGALDTADNPVEGEKPKGFFAGLKDKIGKINQKVDEFGNKTFGAAINKVKEFWAKQAKLMKYLIVAVIAATAIGALVAIIIGIFSVGTISGVTGGLFKLVAAGYSFYGTYKQGKKSFETR